MDILERMPWAAQNSVFQKLASIAEVGALSKEDRIKYDESLRKFRDTISVMEGQRLEGKAEGLAEGRAEGRTEGLAEGKAEVAVKLKAMGLSVSDIAEATGLSPEQVEAL